MGGKIPRNFDNLKKLRPRRPGRPSLSAIVAVMLVAGGVAFALLQSQVSLTGNAVQTDSAGLLISRDGSNYSTSASGFDFVHIIPGVQPSQSEHFTVQNTGSASLAFKVGMSDAPSNPNDLDLSKVSVMLTPYGAGGTVPGTPQNFTLQSLMDSADGVAIDGPSLESGGQERFDIQVAMDQDTVSGSGAALSGLDLTFTGVAVADGN